VADLLKYCGDVIPELALLVVKQTRPDLTLEEVKKLGRSPFKLGTLVIMQIEHNKIIEEIGIFSYDSCRSFRGTSVRSRRPG
jgi:hypothetical protein